MPAKPKKVVIFGMDAPIAPRLYKYCKEGKLPNMARVLKSGVWAKNCLVPYPTITPPNWTSIATGAWPSTHGITDFNSHRPGKPLDQTNAGFFSQWVHAETIWNAIARAGKKSVIVNYPVTWPPNIKNGYQLGGASIEMNSFFWPPVLYDANGKELPYDEAARKAFEKGGTTSFMPPAAWAGLSYERFFASKNFKPDTERRHTGPTGAGAVDTVEFKPASGWSNMPKARQALEGELVFRPARGRYQMVRPVWQLLVLDTTGKGFDKLLVCDKKDAANPMAELKEGDWSPIITREFETNFGTKKGGFTMKLLELSKDAQSFRLYHSHICGFEGFSYPESLASEIKSPRGLPYPDGPFNGFDRGWFDIDTCIEMLEFERNWLSDASTYILKHKEWDLFMIQYHPPDHAWHSISWLMDPLTARDEAEWKKYQAAELKVYEACDRLAGDIFACADPEETIFALISDHGAKATTTRYPDTAMILEKAGLTVRDAKGEIDWSKTKAVSQRVVYAYVNLKGRDPQGIVEPGKEYREVQDKIIEALTSYVDPQTGIKPYILALRKEDARFINIYGDYVGDVVYALSERVSQEHGHFLPTAELGIGSMKGVFALSGPGVKKGIELERNVWIVDLVPTLCYLTGWPMPKEAEGAVIFQALEDPDPR